MPRRKQVHPSAAAAATVDDVPLAYPDRGGPDPTRETLLALAEKRGLLRDDLQQGDGNPVAEDSEPASEEMGRVPEALMWSSTLTMVHFTLDVLVQHQYAMDRNMSWAVVFSRSIQSFPIMFLLMYVLHPHPHATHLVPGIRAPSAVIRELIFFAGSVAAGCYLIYISNVYGYLAMMKRAPPVGCMWIWAVIELNLPAAVASLVCCVAYMWWNGFGYT